jgi:hypothetical protein
MQVECCSWVKQFYRHFRFQLWILTCLVSGIQLRAAVISEFMAANVATITDVDGEFPDWIEIFNPDAATVQLAGWSLTDDVSDPQKWQFPATNLSPGGRMIVFASGKDRRTPGAALHTNFRLDADGEYLALTRPDGSTATAFSPNFPKQRVDVSYGALADGITNGFLASPTPGAANVNGVAEFVADTKFSHDRGLYGTNFNLVLTCATPNALIYYTTDGSSPSATNGRLYTGPIPISGTTVLRARAEKSGARPSNVDSQTYIFLRDVVSQQTQGTAPAGWPTSWGLNVVDYGMDPDVVNQAPWNATISNDLQAVPTLSLVMRLEDLFDAQTGIYANAEQQGRAWERPCSLELIYPDGRNGFQIDAGVRIRGGVGRLPSNPKHSVRFLFREEYGASKLRFKFFGDTGASEFDGFDLRATSNFSWASYGDPDGLFIHDPFARRTQLDMGQPGERGGWYHLYINGQYWGLYNAGERPEASFAATYFGGEPEDYDVLKPDFDLGATMQPTDGDGQAWTRLWNAAVSGFASNADYFRVQGRNSDGTLNPAYENLLDVVNLVDYLLSIAWTGNTDGPVYGSIFNWDLESGFLNNYFTFRSRRNTGGFRFIAHDAEWVLRDVQESRVLLTTSIGSPAVGDGPERSNPFYLWARLLANTEFRQLVADRIQKHFLGNGALTRDACTARFLALKNEIDRAIVGESARWGDAQHPSSPLVRDDWVAASNDKLTNYFPDRTDIVLNQFRAAGLFPSLGAPSFSLSAGEVPVGAALALAHANASGAIFYTMDGSDPRTIGGSLNPNALNYAGPIPISTSRLVRARVKNGTNWSPLSEAFFYPQQDFSGLRLSEIMYHPLGAGGIDGDQFEFVELKNAGTNSIDLGGLRSTGITFTFAPGTILTPGSFFVLASSATNFAARYPGVALGGVYSGKLDNGGERLALQTAAGIEILSVTYDDALPWSVTPDGHGFSLVNIAPAAAADPNDSRFWRASSVSGGSPGTDDPAPTIPPVVINEFLSHSDLPQTDFIELFNPTTMAADLGGWFLSDDAATPRKFRIPDGTILQSGAFLYFTEDDFNPGGNGFAMLSTGEQVYLFSGTSGGTNLTGYVHGVNFDAAATGESFGRYLNSSGEEQFPPQISQTRGAPNAGPRIGPVVINEMYYHPSTNQDEFIEILNLTAVPVNFFDPAHPTNTWRLNGLGYVFPLNFTLPANGLVLLVGIDPATFRAKYAVPQSVPILGPYQGVLQDGGEALTLQRPDTPTITGEVPYIGVDEVRYNDRAPWPVAADGDGASLHRLAAAAYGNDAANWFAANPTPGQHSPANPDSDGDGLPDVWEQANGTQVGIPDAGADPDGDGHTNFQEFLAGTSPTNAASALRLRIAVTPAGLPAISFTRVAGVSYTLQYRTSFAGGWLPLTNLAAGSSTAVFEFVDPAFGASPRYYRLATP